MIDPYPTQTPAMEQTPQPPSPKLPPIPPVVRPKRLSPLRFLVPVIGAVLLTSAVEYLFASAVSPFCGESNLLCIPLLAGLFFALFIGLPLAFAFIGARRNPQSRLSEGVVWFMLALASSWMTVTWLGMWFADRKDEASASLPHSFQECVEAGYPVAESYPRHCFTPKADFYEEVTGEPVTPAPSYSVQPIACTADAFQCPDGTWVGRTGPRCQFVCP